MLESPCVSIQDDHALTTISRNDKLEARCILLGILKRIRKPLSIQRYLSPANNLPHSTFHSIPLKNYTMRSRRCKAITSKYGWENGPPRLTGRLQS